MNHPPPGPRRIAVVGTSGSGKTTLAHRLAERLGIPHVELDALHWGPNWTPVAADLFRERVAQALSGEAWVVDGNYSRVRDIIWTRADTLVWLDYSWPVDARPHKPPRTPRTRRMIWEPALAGPLCPWCPGWYAVQTGWGVLLRRGLRPRRQRAGGPRPPASGGHPGHEG